MCHRSLFRLWSGLIAELKADDDYSTFIAFGGRSINQFVRMNSAQELTFGFFQLYRLKSDFPLVGFRMTKKALLRINQN